MYWERSYIQIFCFLMGAYPQSFVACGSETNEVYLYHSAVRRPLMKHSFDAPLSGSASSAPEYTVRKSIFMLCGCCVYLYGVTMFSGDLENDRFRKMNVVLMILDWRRREALARILHNEKSSPVTMFDNLALLILQFLAYMPGVRLLCGTDSSPSTSL